MWLAPRRRTLAEPRHVYTVSYSDLNLETEQGAKILLSRLQQAAQIVCKPLESRNLSIRAHWQVCVNQALASAVSRVNNKAVTALYQSSLAPNKG